MQGIGRTRLARLAVVAALVSSAVALEIAMPTPAAAATPTTIMLSGGSTGGDFGWLDDSMYPKTSAGGVYTAFATGRENYLSTSGTQLPAGGIPPGTFGMDEVIVRQVGQGQNFLPVSRGTGNAWANGPSLPLDISADGRWVLFTSKASNLVAGDTNDKWDLFVWDRTLWADWANANRIRRVSLTNGGAQTSVDIQNGAISDDGTKVVFQSTATNLVGGDTNGVTDVFVRNLTAGTTTRVSVTSGGAQAVGGNSITPSISGNGNVVAFASAATNLGGNTGTDYGIYVRNLVTNTTQFVAGSYDGEDVEGSSFSPVLSYDGQVVAFESEAENLVEGDENSSTDVFAIDLQVGVIERLSVSDAGEEGDDESYNASITDDGRFVAFDSDAENLVGPASVPGGFDSNFATDVFVRDRWGGRTERVSLNRFHEETWFESAQNGHISPDGRYVVFDSEEDEWQPIGDENWAFDVFRRDRGRWLPGPPKNVAAVPSGGSSAVVSWAPPDDTGNENITGYTVTAAPGGQTCTRPASPPHSCTVTGLAPGISQSFTVRATNQVGLGAPSAPVIWAGAPGPPTGVTAAAGNASATVSWSAPANDGGAPITNYTVTASPGGRTCTRPGPPLSCTVNQLTNGASYTFTVRATNSSGQGPASSPSNQVTPSGGSDYVGLTPARLMETRPGLTTVDGQFNGQGPIGPGASRNLTVAGRGGVPANATAVVLNVTATQPTIGGFMTVWPMGQQRPNASNLNFTAGQTIPNSVVAKVGNGGQVSFYNDTGSTHVIVDVLGYFGPGASYEGLTPARLMETRPNLTTTDGQFNGQGPIGPGASRNLTVAGRGGVPANASAVVLNVTATQPTVGGFKTVWPTGQPRPNASNLNFTAGQTIPNLVVAKVGNGGQVSFYNDTGSTHVIVDVLGFFQSTTPYIGLTPARLMETRPGFTTVDGQFNGQGAIGPGGTRELVVSGRGNVPAGASAVVLNVTATQPTVGGFMTVWPTLLPRPTASNLNFTAGQTIPNLVVAKVGANGRVSFYNNSGSTHVIVDVLGAFP